MLFMAFCVLGLTVNARPDVELGVSADEDGLREFHMAIGDFYNVGPGKADTGGGTPGGLFHCQASPRGADRGC
jgi:hypothetical protein